MAKDKNIPSKKIANIWDKYSNPLRYLNSLTIEQMLNQARYGNDSKLQICYFECEKSNPIFSACISKRIAGVQDRNWDIVPVVDSDEARAQAEAVKKMFEDADMLVEDNLTDAISHLVLGSFRGRAAVKPFVIDGKLSFKKIENWYFLRYANKNYFNPEAVEGTLNNGIPNGIVEIPRDEVCYVYDDKPYDWIGIQIYLRQMIGEDLYARFVEKQGIPQVLLTCPEGVPDQDLEKFNYRAQAIYEGGSGTVPFGTDVHFLTEARGQDPFTAFINHQSEMFCILATGGTLDILAGTQGSSGTGMGSSVSDNQKTQFDSLVNFDCKKIQNAMSVAVSKCIESLGARKALCRFEYVEKENTKPMEYLELAQKLVDIGVPVDIAKLKELTNLSFIKDDQGDIWKPTEKNDGE